MPNAVTRELRALETLIMAAELEAALEAARPAVPECASNCACALCHSDARGAWARG